MDLVSSRAGRQLGEKEGDCKERRRIPTYFPFSPCDGLIGYSPRGVSLGSALMHTCSLEKASWVLSRESCSGGFSSVRSAMFFATECFFYDFCVQIEQQNNTFFTRATHSRSKQQVRRPESGQSQPVIPGYSVIKYRPSSVVDEAPPLPFGAGAESQAESRWRQVSSQFVQQSQATAHLSLLTPADLQLPPYVDSISSLAFHRTNPDLLLTGSWDKVRTSSSAGASPHGRSW